MEKKWLFTIGITLILIVVAISFISITETTGSFVYGKCWKITDITPEEELTLKMQGCVIEDQNKRICCPFETCPAVGGITC